MTSQVDTVELIVEIRDRYGVPRTVMNFSSLQLPHKLAEAIRDCFEALTGQNSVETRRQVWRCIRKFSKFLTETESEIALPMRPDVLVRFRNWLAGQNLGGSTCQSHFNEVRRALLWINRNSDLILHTNTVFSVPAFVRAEPEDARPLDREAIKQVLAACYAEIDQVHARMNRGRRVLAGEDLTIDERGLHVLLFKLLNIGKGVIPSQKSLKGKGISMKEINHHGGLRNLWKLISPSAADVFPFYLAILAQCSGNPMSIRNMSRDCIRAHPLREDRRSLVWLKERSNREQIADFSVKRPRSAPILVGELLEINGRLVKHMSPSERNLLFLSNGNSRPSVPCMQLLHVLLDAFISRHNLASFDFKQLRKAGAALHFRVSNDIQVPRSRLNHRSSKTTFSYIASNEVTQENDRLINRFQGELVAQSTTTSSRLTEKVELSQIDSGDTKNSSTVFGFGCKDPYAGVWPGSVSGKMCMKFTSCATCPGAIVVLDDIRVVARLIKSSTELKSARQRAMEEGWMERFNALYDGVQKIIDEELLARTNPMMIEKAKSLIGYISLPTLE